MKANSFEMHSVLLRVEHRASNPFMKLRSRIMMAMRQIVFSTEKAASRAKIPTGTNHTGWRLEQCFATSRHKSILHIAVETQTSQIASTAHLSAFKMAHTPEMKNKSSTFIENFHHFPTSKITPSSAIEPNKDRSISSVSIELVSFWKHLEDNQRTLYSLVPKLLLTERCYTVSILQFYVS